jgi:hypothetical protein
MKKHGVPLTFANLQNVERDFWNVECVKKFDVWICNAASSSASLTLLDSFLSGIPYYYMAMFFLNKLLPELDKVSRSFLWMGKKKKRAYLMVKKKRVCISKNKRGLGVKDLQKQNIRHLCK